MAASTGHAMQYRGDYRRARTLRMHAVRESVGWRLAERGGRYDFSRALAFAQEARRQGIAIIWSLWHYGCPRDVDPFDERVVERFASFCAAAARALKPAIPPDAWFNPVNEISFTCWLLTEGRTGARWCGAEATRAAQLKRNLCRAAVRGAAAVREVLPAARIVHIDPVIHAVPQDDAPEHEREAAGQRASQYEAWDLLCDPAFEPAVPVAERVQMIGVNHYHSSQWVVPSRKPLRWHLRDPRRRPLHALTADVVARYGLPFFIAETSHFGAGRRDWIRDIANEIAEMRRRAQPIAGACVYPFIDRPDWDAGQQWHRSGVCDAVPRQDPRGPRRLFNRPYCDALLAAQRFHVGESRERRPEGAAMEALIVFSHLRWNHVWQRPQHLITRFAKRFRVLVVEEPCFEPGEPRAELSSPAPGVTILRPHTGLAAPGFHDDQIPAIRTLLQEAIATLGLDRYGLLTFTPMALPLMHDLAPLAIAYDCMDQLSAFRHAPRQLPQRESALLRVANVVFTGGPSLHRAKRAQHDNAHCFPSSVDAAHFGTARSGAHVHADVAAVPGPRLGCYGVIDERLDLDLIDALARARPDWQWFYVGPVAKIDVATLPRADNLHWLPQQPYEALPALVAGWDVCVMPFARNPHTEYISPTKTLEFLAADKPVVTTPIADAIELYGEAISAAAGCDDFVAACAALIGEDAAQRARRVAAARRVVSRTSWDATAAAMADLLDAAARAGLVEEARTLLQGASTARPRSVQDTECLILGAGPTGLSAAYHYGANATLLERESTVGGWCRSIADAGFTFDCAGHIMFSNDPGVQALYTLLLGDNVHWQDREAWVYSKGVHTRYPFQGSLHGLPPDVLKECVMGAIEARYGTADARPANAHEDCCADGTQVVAGENACTTPLPARAAPRNFEEFIHATWGSGIARHFALPYNRKLWTYPLTDMETSWLGGRVPLPDLDQIVEGALVPSPKPMGPNARFGYPLRGGFQALMDAFLPHLRGPLELRADVVGFRPSRREIRLADGRAFRYDVLVSTLPLPALVAAAGDEAPPDVRAAARRLRHVSVRCVNFGIGREHLSDKHWIYYPEDTIFHRVFLQGNASPFNNAPGGFALTCEMSYSPARPLPLDGAALVERCRADLVRVGLIRDDDRVLTANQVDMPCAYVLYDHQREASVTRIRDWLARHNVLLAGRYAEWAYYNSDHAFIAGRDAARRAGALCSVATSDARIA